MELPLRRLRLRLLFPNVRGLVASHCQAFGCLLGRYLLKHFLRRNLAFDTYHDHGCRAVPGGAACAEPNASSWRPASSCFKMMMHLVHPDKCTEPRAGEAFGEMQSIKSLAVVSDPDATRQRPMTELEGLLRRALCEISRTCSPSATLCSSTLCGDAPTTVSLMC